MSQDLENYYLPALREAANKSVLDFGSGHGRMISFLREAGFLDVRGFERNESLRSELSPEVLERTTFGADWSFFLRERGEKRWDAVILKDVLYYFNDPEAIAFLRELRPHLSDQAILAVEVFNGATLTGPYVMYKDRGIRRIFTEHSLQSLLTESGYLVTSMEGIRPSINGVRSALFYFLSIIWKWNLRMIYWSERGADQQNPVILEKKIFAVARINGDASA